LQKHLSMESMEVVLGLLWEGYTEKPDAFTFASTGHPANSPAPAPAATPVPQ